MTERPPAAPGTRNLITDVPGLKIGQAHDAAARTGVTVILPDDRAVAACFPRAYGNSPVYAGSYLRTADGGLRRFAPAEIARLHGHARTAALEALPLRHGWKLVGNGLSVPVVRC